MAAHRIGLPSRCWMWNGCFRASPPSTHSNQPEIGVSARWRHAALKNLPWATFSARALIGAARSRAQNGLHPHLIAWATRAFPSNLSVVTAVDGATL